MDDENLSSKNQKGNNHPDDNASGATPQNGGSELPPERNDFRVNFFEIGGGGIALIIGIMLDVAGFHKTGLCFDSIALACAIGLLDHYIKEKTKFKQPRRLFWILMGLNFVLLGFLWIYIFSNEANVESKPVVMVNNSPANISPEVENNVVRWLPPELPPDCSNAFIFIGGQPFTIPLWIYNNRPIKASTNLLYVSWIFSNSVTTFQSPISISVFNNRLFIFAKIPFNNKQRQVLMSDDLDGQIPPNWERNFSRNAFEIVNEATNPILQVIYKRANEVQINGVFFTDTNYFLKAFGNEFEFLNVFIGKSVYSTNETIKIPLKIGIRTIVGNPMMTNIDDIYGMSFGQKALFKYPSWKHLGEYAD
jgi:hypothetical protein